MTAKKAPAKKVAAKKVAAEVVGAVADNPPAAQPHRAEQISARAEGRMLFGQRLHLLWPEALFPSVSLEDVLEAKRSGRTVWDN